MAMVSSPAMTEGELLRDAMLRAFTAAGSLSRSFHKEWAAETGIEHYGEVLLLLIFAYDPHPVPKTELFRVSPYTHPDVPDKVLRGSSEQGYVIESEEGYCLTDLGRRELRRGAEGLLSCYRKAQWLRGDESDRMSDFLGRVLNRALEIETPEPWYAGNMARLMPKGADGVSYSLGCIWCLETYRYDCHWAAWREMGIDPIALDTLTVLWEASAGSLEEIVSMRYESRGHSPETYSLALGRLRSNGYIDGSDAKLELTTHGRSFRDAIEMQTNRYHFAPHNALSDEERNELGKLLTDFAAAGGVSPDAPVRRPG